MTKKGFTLIELLIVIAIIGILTAISAFGLSQARQVARDGKRKNDLEYIRSGIETYRADCGTYPTSATFPSAGSPLKGTSGSGPCSSNNTYISAIPADPLAPSRVYYYWSDGTTYQICSALEGGSGAVACNAPGPSACGTTCNYKVTNP